MEWSRRRHDVRASKIVAHEQQRVARDRGARIGQAVAEVQRRPVPAATEARERVDRNPPFGFAEAAPP